MIERLTEWNEFNNDDFGLNEASSFDDIKTSVINNVKSISKIKDIHFKIDSDDKYISRLEIDADEISLDAINKIVRVFKKYPKYIDHTIYDKEKNLIVLNFKNNILAENEEVNEGLAQYSDIKIGTKVGMIKPNRGEKGRITDTKVWFEIELDNGKKINGFDGDKISFHSAD